MAAKKKMTTAQMKARMEKLSQESDALRKEATDLMYAIQRADDVQLVGKFFFRNGISRPEEDEDRDDGWKVWTAVESFDDRGGARGIEFRHAGGSWFDVALHEHCRRDEVGRELTREEFYSAVQPLLDRLAHLGVAGISEGAEHG
jgi:hypothetical protein